MNARNGFENFFSVTKIELVLFVTKKLTSKRMEKRKNHGLVYYEKPYGKRRSAIKSHASGRADRVLSARFLLRCFHGRRRGNGRLPRNQFSCARFARAGTVRILSQGARNRFFRTFCAPKKPGKKNAPATRNNAFRACMPSSPP